MIFLRAKSFVYAIFILLLLFIVSYILLYFAQITKSETRETPHSYKTFLIQATRDFDRIIIESGSNSTHSINSLMMEKAFNKVVINLADNAGYPLRHKLFRIKKYSKQGDLIILPLEYSHYRYKDIPEIYYDSIFDYLSFYFKILPFTEKIKFISQTPISSFFKSFYKKNNYTKQNTNSFDTGEFEFIKKFNKGVRGDYDFIRFGKRALAAGMKNKTCEDYVIREIHLLSDVFKNNIKLIKEIEKENKVRFFFTYPAFAGDNCYTGKYKDTFIKFNATLQKFLEKKNIPLIGNFKDSYFTKKYMNDSYAHIMPEAKDIRTKKLIENIKKSPFFDLFNNEKIITPKLGLNKFFQENLKTIEMNKKYDMSMSHYILSSGWYAKEKWGQWSKGNSSEITFKIDENLIQNHIMLKIKSRSFGSKETTGISVNGNEIGSFLLQGNTDLKIDKKYINSSIVSIEFDHQNIKSPKELGKSGDKRKIKLGLETIEVSTFR